MSDARLGAPFTPAAVLKRHLAPARRTGHDATELMAPSKLLPPPQYHVRSAAHAMRSSGLSGLFHGGTCCA
jgi:hypothetical protein